MNKQEANAKIESILSNVRVMIKECESLADQHGLSFRSPIEIYGMGGYFYGKSKVNLGEKLQEFLRENPTASNEAIEDFISEIKEWKSSDSVGWQASSQSC